MKRSLYYFLVLSIFLASSFFAADIYRFSDNLLPPERDFEETKTVDLIVVLTGGRGRFKQGLELLKKERGSHLLVSGTGTNISLEDILSANNLEELADAYRERIILGDLSRSTEENAQEIKSVSEKLNVESILLVTSSYHIRRALNLLKRELNKVPQLEALVYYHPVETPNFHREYWWKSRTGWQIFLSEYFKSLSLRAELSNFF
jgi:uncharacterized SAM-binding protein YcdF (DUF218 family)